MKKTVFSALIIPLSLMLINASFAETPNKNNLPPIPLQLDSVDIQETLDLGNQVIRIQRLNGQQPIKKERKIISVESLADKAAKTTIPFSSDPNQVVKIDEPFKKIDDIQAVVKNKIKQDSNSVENSQPAQIQQEQTVNAEANQQAVSVPSETPLNQAEGQPAQLIQPPAQDGSLTPVAQQTPLDLKVEEDAVIQGKVDKYHKAKAFWKWFKGEPAYDAALLAMWSYHTKYDDRSTINERNELWGAQYAGFIFGTFRNTFSHRSYMAGAARRVWKKDIYKGFGVDLQYKAGLVHGYGDRYPNLAGCTPLILPIVGFNYGTSGVDMWFVPSNKPVFMWSLRLGLPQKYQYVNRKKMKKTVIVPSIGSLQKEVN